MLWTGVRTGGRFGTSEKVAFFPNNYSNSNKIYNTD